MNHYVYRITNIILNKHYYGKRSTKINPKSDLGIKYFSSSKDRKFLLDQKKNPDNYKYKIILQCKSSEEALLKEIYLHNKFNVGKNKYFYNKVKQSSKKFDTTGLCLLSKKEKLKRSKLWKEDNPNNYRKLSGKNNPMFGIHRFGKDNPFYGRKHSLKTKIKISKANKGRKVSLKTKKLLSSQRKGVPKTKMKCPYCDIEMSIRNLKVLHIPKCELNNNI